MNEFYEFVLPICVTGNTNSQINMAETAAISGVVVQGRHDKAQWVTSFKVGVSTNLKDWNFVEDGRIFEGNNDHVSKLVCRFDRPVEAQQVRIFPESWWD